MNVDPQLMRTESEAALEAAFALYEQHPVRGTPEWSRWRTLCRQATEANDRYIRMLESPARPVRRSDSFEENRAQPGASSCQTVAQ